MNYNQCYIEQQGNFWYICFPDGSRAWDQGYKTRQWATRVLNWLIASDRKRRDLKNLVKV